MAEVNTMFRVSGHDDAAVTLATPIPLHYEMEGEEEMDEGSVAELMEIDIISLNEDDFDYEFEEEMTEMPRQQPESNSCFSFGFSSNPKPATASPERKWSNYCGLETWGMSKPMTSQAIGQGYMHPNIGSQQQSQPQSIGSGFSYNPTTFFCSR